MLDKRQITLPQEICEAAGLEPGDRVDWRFEDGDIRGRKFSPKTVEVLDIGDVDPNTLLPKVGIITPESIVASIRADRERQK